MAPLTLLSKDFLLGIDFGYFGIFKIKLVYWGVESNWVHSALWPPISLLRQPRVIMMMEKLVE
jgi:hypothetical protein